MDGPITPVPRTDRHESLPVELLRVSKRLSIEDISPCLLVFQNRCISEIFRYSSKSSKSSSSRGFSDSRYWILGSDERFQEDVLTSAILEF